MGDLLQIYPLIYLAFPVIYLFVKKSNRIWVTRILYVYILSVFFVYQNNISYFDLIKKGNLVLIFMLIAFATGLLMTFSNKKGIYYLSVIPLLAGCALSWIYGSQVGYYNPLFEILIPILAFVFYVPWSDKTITQIKKNLGIISGTN